MEPQYNGRTQVSWVWGHSIGKNIFICAREKRPNRRAKKTIKQRAVFLHINSPRLEHESNYGGSRYELHEDDKGNEVTHYQLIRAAAVANDDISCTNAPELMLSPNLAVLLHVTSSNLDSPDVFGRFSQFVCANDDIVPHKVTVASFNILSSS